MCRIDAPFRDISLEEKSDPVERFIQALDESNAIQKFRSLLIQCFRDNWTQAFRSASELEDFLNSSKEFSACPDRSIAFLRSWSAGHSLRFEFSRYTSRNDPEEWRSELPLSAYKKLNFAKAIAQEFFPESPFELYRSGLGDELDCSYDESFVDLFYGQQYSFSKAFLADPALEALPPRERAATIFHFFEQLAKKGNSLLIGYSEEKDTLGIGVDVESYNILLAAQSGTRTGPPTLGNNEFCRGLSLLKLWIKEDTESGRMPSEAYEIIDFWFDHRKRSLQSVYEAFPSDSPYRAWVKLGMDWLRSEKRELKTTYYRYQNLDCASESEIERWAEEVDDHFRSYCRALSLTDISFDERPASEAAYLAELCSQFSSAQVNHWIQWCLKGDLSLSPRPALRMQDSQKWWNSEYSDLCKGYFEDALGVLKVEDQLCILSHHPFRFIDEHLVQSYRDWWNGLLCDLVDLESFPKHLLPEWSVLVLQRFPDEKVIPYVSESIGILRGETSKAQQPEPEHEKQLETLLQVLDRALPEKSLRHRLLLMRSSKIPFSDASISRLRSLDSDQVGKWYAPFDLLANNRYVEQQYDARASRVAFDHDAAKYDCFQSVASEIAGFCLSRLRLRKGEKVEGGSYEADQVVESSPVWRQGYLKALIELGVDPGGKVHKTAHFTKQADPSRDVQEIAAECYRNVRRESKKSRSLQDLKRSLIAAEWWLLMCQRLELNEDVNHDEALKTRRRLLRNP